MKKRTLLLTAAIAMAATGFAQNMSNDVQANFRSLPKLVEKNVLAKEIQAPRKDKTNGIYYATNGYWRGFGLNGMGYGSSMYVVPPFVDVTFENRMANPTSGSWSINGQQAQGDANGNYTYQLGVSYSDGAAYYAPTLTSGSVSYNFGENNVYYKRNMSGVDGIGRVKTDSINVHYPTDDHAWRLVNGTYYSNTASWGILSTDWMFGSGTWTDSDGNVYNSVGMEQVFAAPLTPLYIESVVVSGNTHATQPLQENQELTAYVTNVVTNEEGVKRAGDEIFYTLKCTSADTIDFRTTETMNGKTIRTGYLRFSMKTVDEFGIETVEPFVMPAGQEFAISFSGFENNSNIDFGADGLVAAAEDEVAPAYVLVKSQADGEVYSVRYSQNIPLKAALISMFDAVDVPVSGFFTQEDSGIELNHIIASNDGQTYTVKNDNTLGLDGAIVGLAIPFADNDGVENYTLEWWSEEGTEQPSWITGYSFDDSYVENWNGYGIFKVTCSALPSNVQGRLAKLVIKGKGVEATNTIFIEQGVVTDGIDGITVDAAKTFNGTFNLAGQRVNDNYKGIVIKEGKKMINK